MYLTLCTLRVSPVYVYRHFSRWLRTRGNLAGPEKLQLYLAFGRLTTPNPGKGCAGHRKVGKNVQFYLAFLRLTTRIPGKGCSCPPKCRQNVQLYLAFLHSTTPILGKGCASPPKCRQNEQPFPALLILTTPIPGRVARVRQSVAKTSNHSQRC